MQFESKTDWQSVVETKPVVQRRQKPDYHTGEPTQGRQIPMTSGFESDGPNSKNS